MTLPLRARRGGALLALLAALSAIPAVGLAQTISGTLMDLESDQPIDLGLVLMYTETGDSVGLDVTDEQGRFNLTSPAPGSFVLLASALGYAETPAGVFELGADGEMHVEYRLAPQPLALDELVVSLERPVLEHRLVRNGFVRRLQRGFGYFITPHDIEESPARSTESLLTHIPSVRVGMVRTASTGTNAESHYRPDLGETVQIRSPNGGWCTPTIYLDGVRTSYETDPTSPSIAMTLSSLAPLSTVDAIEVYRRATEIPPEYAYGQAHAGRLDQGGTPFNTCGVLVVWTKMGPAAGQPVTGASRAGDYTGEPRPLPVVEARGPAPSMGERIRLQLEPEAPGRFGVSSPMEGVFLTVRGADLVVEDPVLGRPVAVPLEAVEVLQVQRLHAPSHALKRGGLAGTAFGVGMWQFLKILCRRGCGGGLTSAWFPAGVTGLVVGVLVAGQGPGTHWVQAPAPAAAGAGR